MQWGAPALLLFGAVSPGPLAGVSFFSFYRIVIEAPFIVVVIVVDIVIELPKWFRYDSNYRIVIER